MACLPLTGTSEYIYDSGWVGNAVAINTTALTVGMAPYGGVFTFGSVISQTEQNVQVVQIAIRETAAATAKKADLRCLLYTTAAPTPTGGAVYQGPVTNLLGSVEFTTANYKRIADLIWEATIQPSTYITSAASLSNVTTIYGVLTDDTSGVTFAGSDAHEMRIWVKQNEQVATS